MMLMRSEDWLVSEVDKEILMMNIERGHYVGLNSSGAAIWELLETPKTVEQLIDLLSRRFDASREQIRHDFDLFLDNALQHGIVKKSDP